MSDHEIKVLDLKDPTNAKNYVDHPRAKGMPVYWGDDQTGRLRVAVMAYFLQTAKDEDLQLVIAYIQYHIHAPCWLETSPFDEVEEEYVTEIRGLRQRSLEMKTIQDVNEYIERAASLALDPL